MRQLNKDRGFSLIELMIVVAVAGILAAIAYPSYLDSVQKSRRADAKASLMAAVQRMEAYYARNGSYTGATMANTNISPTSEEGYYTITIPALSASSYTLQAVPTSKGNQNGDEIQGFRLASTGAKTHSTDGSSYTTGWK